MRDEPGTRPRDPYAAPVAEPRLPQPLVPSAELPLAGRGSRLWARFIDTFLMVMAMLPGMLLVGVVDELAAPDTVASNLMLASGVFLLVSFPVALLVLNIWLLVKDGQTPGKRIAGVRIVTVQGQQASWEALLLKRIGALWAINFALACVGLNSFFGLADALFIFRQDRRCIHDFIAGTTVVEASHRPWD